MTLNKYQNMWCIKGDLRRVRVMEVEQKRTKRLGSITVWKEEFGTVYSPKHIKRWDELSEDQKKRAYRDLYQAKRNIALFEISKDSDFGADYSDYISRIKAERDDAISKIDSGVDPGEPPHVWE